ncbi:MAG: tetratricopeptide (TPR) repeat protein, partial [Hyphomicrobiaceae bacterium]
MLALSPGNRRSRAWLQDKLWSDRGEQQGATSLRQSLSEIRRSLGSDKVCFRTDNQTVQLDPQAIVLSYDHGSNNAIDDVELLEGLDVRDPEFEDWLREQRRVFRDRRASNACASTNVSLETRSNDISKATIRLYVQSEVSGERDGTEVLTCAVSDMMAKSIKEMLSADVIDQRRIATTPERESAITDVDALELTSEFASVNGLELFRFSLTHTLDNTVIWTDTVPCQSLFEQGADSTEPLRHVNQVANIAASFVANAVPSNRPERLALHYCQLGVTHLFRLGRANFEAADRLFGQAYDLHPRGLFLGWRAYLRLFMHAERQFLCRQTLDEEALEYAAKAMELEPYNSVVTSLAAHVHLTVKRSYASAYELAEQSIQLNRANCLGWL